MKAMVLAAGVGSRLRPLTGGCPKALIEVRGTPMLEIVIRRLIEAGVDGIVVNAFHLADKIEEFVKARGSFGIRVELSRETELLDTGGGLKKAAWFFDDGRPFFLHNADVFSEVDLGAMYRFHVEKAALATLAVRARKSGRGFLFDEAGRLCGWCSDPDDRTLWSRGPVAGAQRLAFDGIHVLSPGVFEKMNETGVFPINQAYLRLAGGGENILSFRTDAYFWRDIGRLEDLQELQRIELPERRRFDTSRNNRTP